MTNPYVGPRTFTYAERNVFFGREREARDLLARVVSERMLLFYAQSGAGKSSLLQTRLIPHLREEEGFAVLPVGRVSGELPAGISQVENIYLFNLMTSLDQSGTNPQRLANLSLHHFLEHLTSDDGVRWYYAPPAATVDRDFEVAHMRKDDAALAAHDDVLDRALNDAPPSTAPPAPHEAYGEQRYVLVIDQFEEIITAHVHRRREREEFFRQLNQALLDDPNLWVVLTLREDYVAALDPYAALVANKLRARFYMERMGVNAALDAVKQPAALAGHAFAKGVAETLVDNLRRIKVLDQAEEQLGQYIEPVQLQVVCYQLWAKVMAAGKSAGEQITSDDLQQSGDVNTALADFYNQALSRVSEQAQLKISERSLRRWVDEELITEAGTRGTVYQGLADTAGMPNPIVKLFIDQFLLRTEQRAGGYWVELVHDRFVEPIRQANAQWRGQYYNPLAAAFGRWQAGGQRNDLLLRGPSLIEAQRFVEAYAADVTVDERDFLARSVSEEQHRSAAQEQTLQTQRRNRIITATVLATVVLVILLAVIGNIALRERQARNAADEARVAEQAERERANHERDRAEQAQERAEQERQNALVQAGKASRARAKQLAAQAQSVYEPAEKLLLAIEAITATHTVSTVASLRGGAVEQSLQAALLQSNGGMPRVTQPGEIFDVTFSPDNRWVAWGGSDGAVYLGQQASLVAPPIVLRGHTGTVFDLAFHPDGRLLASASGDRTVRLWSVTNPATPPVVLQGHTAGIARIAFSPDGKWLVSASTDQTLRLWSMDDFTRAPTVFTGHTGLLRDAAFSPNSKLLASASQDKTIRLWQVDDPAAAPLVLAGHSDGVAAIAFSIDGGLLASASWDSTVRIWNVADLAKEPVILPAHEAAVQTLEFSPDQQWLATAGNDRVVKLWSLADLHAAPLLLYGMTDAVFDVSFSKDSHWLAAAGLGGNTRLWALADLQEDASADAPVAVTAIYGQTGDILSVNFSEDDGWLAAASKDGSVQFWPIAVTAMLDLACRRAERNFTAEEWEQYFGDEPYQRTCRAWPVHASVAEALYAKGKALAEEGQLSAALERFVQVLALDPTRTFDPNEEAERLQKQAEAQRLVEEGRGLAQDGDVSGAVTQFQQALQLDATLPLDPETEAAAIYVEVQRTQAQHLLQDAQELARTLAITDAIEVFGQALALDQTLAIDPEHEAKRLAAERLVSLGRTTAQSGQPAAAVDSFRQAKLYDPTLSIEPEVDAQVEYGRGLANRGAFAAAMEVFAETQQTHPAADIASHLGAQEWDGLCRTGSLADAPAIVLPACERAVAQAPENGNFRAARGFARALLNDIEGAIDDFQFYVAWARQFPELSAKAGGHKAWITALRAGVNPVQAYVWARNGKVDAAIGIYHAFHQLTPPLQLTADEWNNLCWSGSLAWRAEEVLYACEWAVMIEPNNANYRDSRGLARAIRGDLVGATEDFEYFLYNSRQIADATRTRRFDWVAAQQVGLNPALAHILARNGQIDVALGLYAVISAAEPSLHISAEEWNTLCWYGSLAARAGKVLDACDRAIAEEPNNGNYHDSRSLARVLTGDWSGAIEDLEFTVTWADARSSDQQFAKNRRFWLTVLRIVRVLSTST